MVFSDALGINNNQYKKCFHAIGLRQRVNETKRSVLDLDFSLRNKSLILVLLKKV
jgi:hypothetical protein